jgi:hypothetical protein
MLIRGLMVAAVLFGVQGCSHGDNVGFASVLVLAAQHGAAAPAAADDASGVYAALLSSSEYHGVRAGAMLVRDKWIAIVPVGDSGVSSWLEEFDGIRDELRQALRRPPAFETTALDRSLFPAGTRFISQELIDAAFSRLWIEDGWTAFRRQYKADGFVSFSHVLVTSDGLDAMVYVTASCGSLCGEGVYHRLHRAGPKAPWSIVKSITSWIA